MDFVYCIITTTTDDKDIANDIAKVLISVPMVNANKEYLKR